MVPAGEPIAVRCAIIGDVARVGVYPGSFNPPTIAHLAIAEAARDAHDLDRLVLRVSRSALAKEHVERPPFDERIEVIEQSIDHLDWLHVEVTHHQLLVDVAAGFDLLIVGADKWHQIHDPVWYDDDPVARDEAIAQLPDVVVVPRDGVEIPAELALHVPEAAGVSSTLAREGAHHLMTPAARAYAMLNGAWYDD